MQLNWSCDLSSLDTVKFLSFFYIKQIANLCKASEMKNMPLWRQLTTDFSGLKIPHSIFNTGAWNHTWIVNIHISSMSWKWSVEIKKKKKNYGFRNALSGSHNLPFGWGNIKTTPNSEEEPIFLWTRTLTKITGTPRFITDLNSEV